MRSLHVSDTRRVAALMLAADRGTIDDEGEDLPRAIAEVERQLALLAAAAPESGRLETCWLEVSTLCFGDEQLASSSQSRC